MKKKLLSFQWFFALLQLFASKKPVESVSKRVDRERDVFLASLPDEKVETAIKDDICLPKEYCTHYFALCHDAYHGGNADVFLCWKLKNCLCTLKQKYGCERCWYKNSNHSLCWGQISRKKEPIQIKLPIAVA